MKRMLISVDREESRAAVVKDNRLAHLEIEPVNRDSVKGNIYRGVIARVEPSLQSAFVDFGRDKQGFLPVGDIHPKLRGSNTDKRAAIQDLIRAGQEILVQVTKDEIGNKGATLTTFISLPGRYLVLMPESEKTGVSRKLGDSARERVKDLTENMKVPDGFGLIVRTAGDSATKLELTKDLAYLNRLWSHIESGFATGKGPKALYHERSLAIRFIRDYFRKDTEQILVDDPDTLAEVEAYLKVLMPRNVSAVERYSGVIPLFARYGIAGQVEDVFSRQVPLPSGGSIVIDQTEALVAVDVNSGRVKGKDIEETARQTNIEAAQQVARQLVLRDLGGLVVIDFIDMRDKKSIREVEAALKTAMKSDKARHKIGRISEFGLLELSRQRLKSSVNKGVFESCSHCSGTGFYRTTESVAASVMRRIHELVSQGDVAYLVVTMPPEAANYLLNARRSELANVEQAYHVSIEVVGVEGMTAAQVTIEHLQRLPKRSGAEQIREARFKRVTRHLDLVRNRLLKREETRIERKLSMELSGAAVDYAEVYAGVIDDTAEVAEEAKKVERKRNNRRKREQMAKQAAEAPVPAATPAAPSEPVAPQPQGFTAWLKGLFGMGTPTATPTEEASVEAQPALPEAEDPKAAEAKPEGETAESGRGRGRSRRRRGRRGGEQGDAVATKKATEDRKEQSEDSQQADANSDDEGGDGRRRRRRRRRRGGRGRNRGDKTTEQLAEEGARAEDSAGADEVEASDSQAADQAHTKPDTASNAAATEGLIDIRPMVAARIAALMPESGETQADEAELSSEAPAVEAASLNGHADAESAEAPESGEEAAAEEAVVASPTNGVEQSEPGQAEESVEATADVAEPEHQATNGHDAGADVAEAPAVELTDDAPKTPQPSYRSVIDLRSGSGDSPQP